MSNRLAEVSGPAGLRIVLLKATKRSAAGSALTTLSYISIRRTVKSGPDATVGTPVNDEELRAKPNALLLEPPYNNEERPICKYLRIAKQRGSNLKYLVVREASGQYVAFMPLASVHAHPKLQNAIGKCTAAELLEWLSTRDEGALSGVKGYVDRAGAARRMDSRASVLQTMYDRRLDARPVLDETGAAVGVAELGRLMQSVIVDLAEGVDTSTS